MHHDVKKVKLSATGLEKPLGFQEAEAPEFLENRHMKVVRSLHPGRIPGTHFCYRLSRPQRHNATRRIKSLKISSEIYVSGDLELL